MLVLCTVAGPALALARRQRLLKPADRLVVLKHVRGSGALAPWQDPVRPLRSRAVAWRTVPCCRVGVIYPGGIARRLEGVSPSQDRGPVTDYRQ